MNNFQDISILLEVNGKIPARRCNYGWLKSKFLAGPAMLSTIEKYETDGFSVRELNVLSKNNITDIPLCKTCKTKRCMIFFGESALSKWCSAACSNKDLDRAKEAARIRDAKPGAKENAAKARKETMLAKYGVGYNSQRADIKNVWTRPRGERSPLSGPDLKLMLNYGWLYDQHVTQKKTYQKIADDSGINKWKIQFYIAYHGIPPNKFTQSSQGERDLADHIESMGVTVERNKRLLKTAHGTHREIDILIPAKNIGIEYDGIYHHSFCDKPTKEQKMDHLWKITRAEELGIHLIRFTDYQVANQTNIVHSIIKSKLGMSTRLFARKCMLREVSHADAKLFLNGTHLSGYSSSKINLGLYYEDELVTVCTFGSPRFSKEADWEIVRFSSKLNTTVVGGLSKLLTHFRKNNAGSILTYADRSISNGASYKTVGFKLVRSTAPGYVWVKGDQILSRYKTQKKNLINIVNHFDPAQTEMENMLLDGYRILYDCGNLVYSMD